MLEQATQNIVVDGTQQKKRSRIYDFFIQGKIKIQITQQYNLTSFLLQTFFISFNILHTILAQRIIKNQSNYSLQSMSHLNYYRQIYLAVFTITLLLKIFFILSLILQIIYFNQQIPFITSASKTIMSSFGVLKEIELSLTAFLCFVSLQVHFPFLVVSIVIYATYAIYFQNYVNRKQITYCTSFYSSLTFRAFLVLSYCSNLIFANIKNYKFYCFFYGPIALAVFIWYKNFGCKLYYNSIACKIFLIQMAIFETFYVKSLQNLLMNTVSIEKNEVITIILIFLSVLFSFFTYLNEFQRLDKSFSIKQFDLCLNKLLQHSYRDLESNSQLIGLLKLEENFSQIQQEYFYDPYLKYSINVKDFYLQKESILRLCIKKRYQLSVQMQDHQPFSQKIIDYCEFLCNFDPNISQIHKYMQRINDGSLNIVQKVKISHMKNFVKEYNKLMSKHLFNDKMPLQIIIESQNCYQQIKQYIQQYIKLNIQIWGMLKLQQISVLQFRKALKQTTKLNQLISQKWADISQSTALNKKWVDTWLYYRYFINNQKLKPKQKQILRLSRMDQTIFSRQSFQEKYLISPLLLYNQETFTLKARHEQGDLIIKEVSQNFISLIGYSQSQVQNCSLSILMGQQLKKEHQQKFEKWITGGYISNQDKYKIKDIQVVTAQQVILPAVKYFKCHYSLQMGLEYFSLIKININNKRHHRSTRLDSIQQSQQIQNQISNRQNDQRGIGQNIFLKEEVFQPVAYSQDVLYLKYILRLFLLIIVLSISVSNILTKDTSKSLTSYIAQYVNYMSIYRFPVVIGTNYIKSFLKIGNQTKVNQQITAATNNFITTSQKQITKITVFDRSINPPHLYFPYYNYSFLANDSKRQIDLFYTIVSCVSSLSKLPINRTSEEYQRFNSYLMPSFDSMMNTTKFKLNDKFKDIFLKQFTTRYWFASFQLAILIVFLGILFKLISNFINRIKQVLFTIIQFNSEQISAIYQYWKGIQDNFQGSNALMRKESTLQINKKEQQISVQLNVSSKQIKKDKQNDRQQVKQQAIIIISIFVIVALAAALQINMLMQLKLLQDLQQAGFYFLKYFPVSPLVTLGFTQKYYSDQYPNEIHFLPNKYDDLLSTLFIFGSYDFIGQAQDLESLFYLKKKNYFFANPCIYNPSLLTPLGISVSKCETLCNHTFKQGLTAFFRFQHEVSIKFIKSKINVTASQLDELTICTSVLSAYVFDSINTWAAQFGEKTTIVQSNNYIKSIVFIIAIVIIHIFVIEARSLPYFEQEFSFSKNIYLNLVPQRIIVNQKVIRQKFIKSGIIN